MRYPMHNRKDPSSLTPQDERIWELHLAGNTPSQISAILGKPSPNNVSSKLTIIKEKLACVRN